MDLFRHQIGERFVYQPMPGYRRFAGEFTRNDDELKMAAAFPRTRMTGMFVAVIEYFQRIGSQTGQSFANELLYVH